MNKTGKWLGIAVAAIALMGMGCETTKSGKTASATPQQATSDKPSIPRWAEVEREGFKTFETEEGRYWVFAEGSEGLAEYEAAGEPGKNATLIGRGPGGATLRSDSKLTMTEYLLSKPGYFVDVTPDGRMWVFLEGSEGHEEYMKTGEPGKNVTLIGKGPNGMTIRSDDKEVIYGYLYSTPYYFVKKDDGRLWVFRVGSEGYEEFMSSGEPGKNFTMIGKGPGGKTMRSDDKEVILGYLASKPGWHVEYEDGRMWVFKTGTKDIHEFITVGEPGKNATIIGKGPNGETVKGPSLEVIKEYLAY